MAKKLNSGNFSTEQLNQLVARIERLEEEKKAIADDIKEVYAEAKAHGFDIKILRQTIRLRKLDKADLAEQEQLLQVYMEALGMLADTPLGEAAVAADLPEVRKMRASIAKGEVTVEVGNTRLQADGTGGVASVPASEPHPHKGARGSGLVGKIHDKLVEAGMQHLGGNQYAPPGSMAAEIAALADAHGASPEVKDIAIRTAKLAETDPQGAAAVVATVHALATHPEAEAAQ